MPPLPPSPDTRYDVIIVGGGASGMVAAIRAARLGKRTLICEKSRSPGRKLLASGGERCNLSNTLSTEEFMERVGRDGRFMGPALALLGGDKLREFFHGIGVPTVVHDGFRVWPETRKSTAVLAGLLGEIERLGVAMALNCEVQRTESDGRGFLVVHTEGSFCGERLILATGGLALPRSGASGGGYAFAERFGHKIRACFPAGVPLLTAESWPARCTAHTIGKAELQVAIKKHARIQRTGDLIFTKDGIRGPVVLDMSRDIAQLLEKHEAVPIWMNLCRGKNQEDWQKTFKEWRQEGGATVLEHLSTRLPREIAECMCGLADLDTTTTMRELSGGQREALIRVLVRTPLTVTATAGYGRAFVTRGGVNLKEVRPDSLESKRRDGLYLCGEVLDLDGPCGGFNLQWAFASGYLAATSAAASLDMADAPAEIETECGAGE
ncbi:MAG: aminoacetone oxidase family FAD-binding enzyme [Planctomycetota bacterium]